MTFCQSYCLQTFHIMEIFTKTTGQNLTKLVTEYSNGKEIINWKNEGQAVI